MEDVDQCPARVREGRASRQGGPFGPRAGWFRSLLPPVSTPYSHAALCFDASVPPGLLRPPGPLPASPRTAPRRPAATSETHIAPTAQPAITSESQWPPRYSRDMPTTRTTVAATLQTTKRRLIE